MDQTGNLSFYRVRGREGKGGGRVRERERDGSRKGCVTTVKEQLIGKVGASEEKFCMSTTSGIGAKFIIDYRMEWNCSKRAMEV